jgi:hypothetical protein
VTNKVVRWRRVDLRQEAARRFNVTVHESTIGKWLHQLGLTRLQPRPFHPKKDAAAQEAFKKNFADLVRQALLGSTACTTIEIWFQDEARVGQKGGHAYIWAEVGSRPPMVRDVRHDSAYLFGAICPERGVGTAIIMPTVNTEAMNEHLQEISSQVAARPRRPDLRRRRLAPDRRRPQGARQHEPAAAPALCAQVEPDGERPGISACQQPLRPGLGRLRRHRLQARRPDARRSHAHDLQAEAAAEDVEPVKSGVIHQHELVRRVRLPTVLGLDGGPRLSALRWSIATAVKPAAGNAWVQSTHGRCGPPAAAGQYSMRERRPPGAKSSTGYPMPWTR